ncbi:TetR/AcrR family transcriptional regulator [Sphingobium boeckii]|uniref:AcrR family transcriptional regulator n=1 Tax=Sphingobium boeckii TaxID=1082345 RepID=A0A7W9AG10_9SPHN|nr:TetR/AcrR family transcriptional regulator [Sphingobium boeckii]MBB5684821.1 AcrR family transcriptional regulator [Sphingobium boeckii]
MADNRGPVVAVNPEGAGEPTAPPRALAPRGAGVTGTRRSEVLAKAASIFAEKGFAATTLREIADALGISRPTVYYYFASKEEILDELVRNVSMEAITTVRLPETTDAAEYRQALRSAVRAVYLYVAASPEMFQMLMSSELHLPQGTSQRFQMAKANFVERVAQLIEAGIAAGAFRKVDAAVAALGIMSMATMRSLSYPDTKPASDQAAADLIADMAVRAIESGSEYDVSRASQVFERLREDLSWVERLVREQ